jgi:hypothetical protein
MYLYDGVAKQRTPIDVVYVPTRSPDVYHNEGAQYDCNGVGTIQP